MIVEAVTKCSDARRDEDCAAPRTRSTQASNRRNNNADGRFVTASIMSDDRRDEDCLQEQHRHERYAILGAFGTSASVRGADGRFVTASHRIKWLKS